MTPELHQGWSSASHPSRYSGSAVSHAACIRDRTLLIPMHSYPLRASRLSPRSQLRPEIHVPRRVVGAVGWCISRTPMKVSLNDTQSQIIQIGDSSESVETLSPVDQSSCITHRAIAMATGHHPPMPLIMTQVLEFKNEVWYPPDIR